MLGLKKKDAGQSQEAGKSPKAAKLPKEKAFKLPKLPKVSKEKTPQAADGQKRLALNLKKPSKPAFKRARKSKKNCFIFMIGDEGTILVFVQAGQVARRLFAPSAEREHVKPMIEIMTANPSVPIYFISDMIDQSYVRHTLPPVSPLSINKLVKRRLDRDFAPEDIKGSLALGRESEGRKEWNFLLISLANNALLQQWIEPIMQMPNHFMGIYLLPVEVQSLIQQLVGKLSVQSSNEEAPSQWRILVLHNKVGGFRQVVIKDNQLIFTRLTQASGDMPAEVAAGNIEQEVQNTIEYLRRLSYSEQAGLDIVMILSQDVRDAVDILKLRAKRVNILTPFEVSQLMNLEQAALSGDRFADIVVASNFAIYQKPRLKLMPAYGKKLDQLYQARLGVRLAAGCIILFIIYSIAMAGSGWLGTKSKINQTEEEINAAQQQLQLTQQQFDSLGKDQNDVMNVTSLYKAAKISKEGPVEFVATLASAKGKNVLIRTFDFKDASYVEGGSSGGSVGEMGGSGAVSQVVTEEEAAKQYTIRMEAQFIDYDPQTKMLEKEVNALVGRLKAAFTGYDVSYDKLKGAEAEDEQITLEFGSEDEDHNSREIIDDANADMATINMTGPNVSTDTDQPTAEVP